MRDNLEFFCFSNLKMLSEVYFILADNFSIVDICNLHFYRVFREDALYFHMLYFWFMRENEQLIS
jgi:hypothetical protein